MSGAGSHDPSRNTGQGVQFCGKLKWVNHVGVAKAKVSSISEILGINLPKSQGYDQKPSDLCLTRRKRIERFVDVR